MIKVLSFGVTLKTKWEHIGRIEWGRAVMGSVVDVAVRGGIIQEMVGL